MERPDLSGVPAEVRAYIESLEAALDELRPRAGESTLEASEPPTTINVISVSAQGVAKRTPRHLYQRQHRGGMGVFDLESPEEDPPTYLLLADEGDQLLIVSNFGRLFHLPVRELPESPVRSKGHRLTEKLPLDRGERLALLLPHQASGYLALVTHSGQVRRFHHSALRVGLAPGTLLYTVSELGLPAAACWTPGDADLFIATRQGRAIRFAESTVPARGGPAIRLEVDDAIVAVQAVRERDGVFLLGAEGRGTIRLMSGFSPNKVPGGGGKTAINNPEVVGAARVQTGDDLLLISRLGKIIRFPAEEIPAKEGVVQGVNIMTLRADECRALAVAPVGG